VRQVFVCASVIINGGTVFMNYCIAVTHLRARAEDQLMVPAQFISGVVRRG
jgi:hypothetical protein